MDNLCHTLTGAALAEAGFKRHTRFGSAALVIAANLPDLDVLSFFSDTPAVALRRGWTHGVLGQAFLPVLLMGALVALDRWRPFRGPGAEAGPSRVRPVPMLILGYVGVFSHVGMDWLNTYGVRLLMPFAPQWFYGDAVFIIDPWLWLVLGAGFVLARRLRRTSPSRWALAFAAIYIVLMTGSARAARERVISAWIDAKGSPPAGVMVGPVPINPFRRTVIVDAGDHYERGEFFWNPTRVRFDPRHVPKNDGHPAAVLAARTDPRFRGILVWSRFPYYEIGETGDGSVQVTLADMRFGRRGMFTATTTVEPEP